MSKPRKNWIPAFAGMTSKDSCARGNGELAPSRPNIPGLRHSLRAFVGARAGGSQARLFTPLKGRASARAAYGFAAAETLRTVIGTPQTSMCPAGTLYHSSWRLRRDSTRAANVAVSVRNTSKFVR
jgi:hypothetical protein